MAQALPARPARAAGALAPRRDPNDSMGSAAAAIGGGVGAGAAKVGPAACAGAAGGAELPPAGTAVRASSAVSDGASALHQAPGLKG